MDLPTRHAWLLILLLFASAASAAAPEPPDQTVARFYTAYLKLGVRGLPDERQSKILHPYLSPGLEKLISAAHKQQDAARKQRPDEKPPWIEGDLFSSLFEGAKTFHADEPAITGGRATVPVHLERADGASFARWTDTFVLVLTPDGWRISDVRMGADWPFKQGETLRAILASPD